MVSKGNAVFSARSNKFKDIEIVSWGGRGGTSRGEGVIHSEILSRLIFNFP